MCLSTVTRMSMVSSYEELSDAVTAKNPSGRSPILLSPFWAALLPAWPVSSCDGSKVGKKASPYCHYWAYMIISSLNHSKAIANGMILIGAIGPLLFNHLELLIHLSVPLLSISSFLQDSLFFKAAPLLGCPSPFLFFALFLFTLNTCNGNTRTYLS